MTEEKLRELFLATNTEEPLAGGWPGLLRYGIAVSLEAKRDALLDAAEQMESYCGPTVYYELHSMAKELE